MLALPLAVLTAAATLVPAGAPDPGARWAWPVAPAPAVVRGYDDVGRYAAGHRGVDLAAAPGQAVLAPAPGRVTFAGPVAGRGVLVLTHEGGLRTSYEPVEVPLPVGTEVTTGMPVATVAGSSVAGASVAGSSVAGSAVTRAVPHCPTTCLHVGLREGSGPDVRYLDPLARFVLADPPVLLPLGGP